MQMNPRKKKQKHRSPENSEGISDMNATISPRTAAQPHESSFGNEILQLKKVRKNKQVTEKTLIELEE